MIIVIFVCHWQALSKKHAVIDVKGGLHLIHDCESKNKTRKEKVIYRWFVTGTVMFYQLIYMYLFIFPNLSFCFQLDLANFSVSQRAVEPVEIALSTCNNK